MKLYYFNPHNYGKEAYVLAESSEKAKEYLLARKRGEQWWDNYMDLMANLKADYTLDEFEVGEVVFGEIC
jgi:hypothetical protein